MQHPTQCLSCSNKARAHIRHSPLLSNTKRHIRVSAVPPSQQQGSMGQSQSLDKGPLSLLEWTNKLLPQVSGTVRYSTVVVGGDPKPRR